jgi:hypothetical protein
MLNVLNTKLRYRSLLPEAGHMYKMLIRDVRYTVREGSKYKIALKSPDYESPLLGVAGLPTLAKVHDAWNKTSQPALLYGGI